LGERQVVGLVGEEAAREARHAQQQCEGRQHEQRGPLTARHAGRLWRGGRRGDGGRGQLVGQASLVIATTIPIRTNTTIATCIQIQVGDIAKAYFGGAPDTPRGREALPLIVCASKTPPPSRPRPSPSCSARSPGWRPPAAPAR